jgi:putative SOS response-associated peptidase YedK
VGRIHDRMPIAIEPENRDARLAPRLDDTDTIRALMAHQAAGSPRGAPYEAARWSTVCATAASASSFAYSAARRSAFFR